MPTSLNQMQGLTIEGDITIVVKDEAMRDAVTYYRLSLMKLIA